MYVAVSKRNDHQIVMHAADIQQNYQTSLDNASQRSSLDWPNYVLGVAHELKKDGHAVSGFNILITGNIPVGAGVSSSAALECATVFALIHLFDINISKQTMVQIAQRAENNFVGVNCGVMDQFASMFGKADHAVSYTHLTLPTNREV